MSMELSTETQAGTGAEPKIPPPGEERAQVFGKLRSCRSTIARLEAKRRRANDDEDKRFRLGADIESMAIALAKLERLALAIHEEELAT